MAQKSSGYMTGKLLVSMPQLQDPRFRRTAIYICGHDRNGAMGLVINRIMPSPTFSELLHQLGVEMDLVDSEISIHFGGPMEGGRGFVLHSVDYNHEATVQITEDVALTATVDILKAIALGKGPDYHLIALGYAGWGAGQLDAEILSNSWLMVPSDNPLLFDGPTTNKWERSLQKIGVKTAEFLASEAGHA